MTNNKYDKPQKISMKRGRPAIRNIMYDTILNVLSESQVPLTVSNLAKFSSQKTGRNL